MTWTLIGLVVCVVMVAGGLALGVLGVALAGDGETGERRGLSAFFQNACVSLVIAGIAFSIVLLAIRSTFYPGHPVFR